MRFRSLIGPTNILLVVLGLVSTLLYINALGIEGAGASKIGWFIRLALTQGALYLVAALIVWRSRPSRSTLSVVFLFAVLFRLSILFAPPLLSDDIYRYIWDGRVQASGVNPYRYIPADDKLRGLRDPAIYPKINRRDYAPTMYPPVAEGIFFLTTRLSESVTWMKLTMMGFEAITLLALMALLASLGFPRQRVLIYAWHPLIIWEFAGSGHLDAIAIAFVALALLARQRRRNKATGLLLACATLVKFFPAVLFPPVYRRWDWKMPVIFITAILLSYAPYATAGARGVLGYLPGYMNEEGMTNGDRYYLLALARKLTGVQIPQTVYIAFAFCLLLAIMIAWLRSEEQVDHFFINWALALAAAFTVLLSPRYPWYFTWLVPFLCFVPAVSLCYLTAASFALYGLWLNSSPESVFAINSALYLPAAFIAAAVGVLQFVRRRTGRRSSASMSPAQTKHFDQSLPPARVSVVIPCLNEQDTIGEVVRAVLRESEAEVIVVDNGSDDLSAERARAAGARVINEPRRGYGRACYAGFQACAQDSDVVVFVDGDGSDCPELMRRLVEPIALGTHDFVVGSRLRGRREQGSMFFAQVAAGHLIGFFITTLYGVRFTDMGPFRAIRRTALERLDMREMTYGWPLEMQMRAARLRLRILEVPVDYRRRNAGRSKISGTVRGTVRATFRIIATFVRVALDRQDRGRDYI